MGELDPIPLVIFIVTVVAIVICVIKDFRIQTRFGTINLDYSKPPIVGMLVLLASRSISFDDVWKGGIVGSDLVTPGYIMIIFNSTAYVYISLDHTGVLAYLAFKVVAAAGSSRRRLFVYFYLLSCGLTLLTSNDIAILTLTPLICYCARVGQMDPLPFLFAQFYAANIMSAVFLIDNPTNIIVGMAFDVTFIEYASWNAIPSFVSAAVAFLVLWLFFRNSLDDLPSASAGFSDVPLLTPVATKLDPNSALIDRTGAIFLSLTVLVNRILLSAAPLYNGQVWSICLATAVLCFIHNAVRYKWEWSSANDEVLSDPANALSDVMIETGPGSPGSVNHDGSSSVPSANPATADSHAASDKASPTDEAVPDVLAPANATDGAYVALSSPTTAAAAATDTDSSTDASSARTVWGRTESLTPSLDQPLVKPSPVHAKPLPTLGQAFAALPIQTVPFVFGMFVMVQALTVGGWIQAFADALARVPGHDNPLIAVLWMTSLSTLLCNLINNQPATILLASVIANPTFLRSVGMQDIQPRDLAEQGTRAALGSIYGVVLGSNFAASFTLLGALAGIMFSKILSAKRVELSWATFAWYGIRMMPWVVLAGCATLWVATLLSGRD